MKNYATLKYKSSGFPDNVQTDAEKNEFLKKLSVGMDIELKQEDITENPAMRSLAKAYLVNLWGFALSSYIRIIEINLLLIDSYFSKLGENCEKSGTNSHFIETEQEFKRIMTDKKNIPTAINILTDRFLYVETKSKQEYLVPNKFHNPVISAFVTAYGRLELLKTLEQLGDLVL